MKKWGLVVLAGLLSTTAMAGINIPSNGSDGQLYVTSNTQIDLSQAITSAWDTDNSANAGKGVYDSNKWAVVFHYTNVYVASGATVTFKNHPSRAPVVWLVDGDVTIDGTVSLDGGGSIEAPGIPEPGPGGFRGGLGAMTGGDQGAGFGPGGGIRRAGIASHGTVGDYGVPAYGNRSLLPLIGGSGGAGLGRSGSSGGGAILVASSQTISLSGSISADGGWKFDAGHGSGGGIRLIAESLIGNGQISAMRHEGTGGAGEGRIRIERVSGSGTQSILPTPSLVALDPGATPQIWVPGDGPSVRIASIGGHSAPIDPRARFGLQGADVQLLTSSSTQVIIETRNVEDTSDVIVRVTPLGGADYSTHNASVHEVVSTDPLIIRWQANVPVQLGHSAMQVRVVRP